MSLTQKTTCWYLSKEALPYWCILTLDTFTVMAFYVFAYYCVLGGNGVIQHFWPKLGYIALISLFHIIFFRVFHIYSNIIRYSTFIDLRDVLFANIGASVIAMIIRLTLASQPDSYFPCLRIIITACCLATAAMCAWRILVKTMYDTHTSNANAKPTFIYGAREGAVSIVKGIRSKQDSRYRIKGLITPDNQVMPGSYVAGIPVYAKNSCLVATLKNSGIKNLIVSPLYIDEFREDDHFINELIQAGIKIYMPQEDVTWDGSSALNTSSLHQISIEDLLPRDKIEINMDAIGQLLTGKKIMITGAAGSIGSELVKQVAMFKPEEMILIDQAETPMHDIRRMMAQDFPDIKAHTIVTNIAKSQRMEQVFSKYRPDYVFHAAAYKHVPMMEDNPEEAVQNNIYGTRIMADLAVKYGTRKFVMISTDKAVNPTNVMGCSKRICEIYCQSLNSEIQKPDCAIKQENGEKAITQFVTTRFGNVLGSNGSVIPIFKEQIAHGGPVTVTHPDIIRYFMLIPEACKLVLEAGTFGKGGEIFVFDMGKPVKIVDLAKRMIAYSKVPNIEIKFTGLRDGEKLYEEVLSDSETTLPTTHPKIRVAKVREYSYAEALQNEERLLKASFTYDDMAVVKIMKEIVPEFKSRHSKYESLD
jgi:FlaA1/EpsC-like NDP-sugar epimerase